MSNNSPLVSDGPVELVHDGTPTGCLCAVAEAFTLGTTVEVCFSCPGSVRPLLAVVSREVASSPERAVRFLRHVAERSSDEVSRLMVRALSARPAEVEPPLLGMARKAVRHGSAILKAHADADVAFVRDWARKVGHEIHRFKGLLRFREFASGRFVALFEPDFDITFPLAFHFRGRLAGQSWVILDCRRGVAATWNGKRLNAETPDGGLLAGDVLRRCLEGDTPSGDEAESLNLWRTFHRTVAIENRWNPALQRQFMPARYWKYLTEMPLQLPEGDEGDILSGIPALKAGESNVRRLP